MIGHSRQREELADLRFQAALLTGPPGVGKWLVAREAAAKAGAITMEVREDTRIEVVREVLGWLQMRPISGLKVAIFDMDQIGTAGQHAMLKTLEEPPAHARLICVAARPVLATIVSRCHVIRFDLLSRSEVEEILRHEGRTDNEAAEMALLGGSISEVVEAEDLLGHRGEVAGYLQALERRDRAAVWAYDERWTPGHTRMLWRWVVEARTGGPKVWKVEDLDMARALGKRGMAVLSREVYSGVRGRFSPAKVALDVWH